MIGRRKQAVFVFESSKGGGGRKRSSARLRRPRLVSDEPAIIMSMLNKVKQMPLVVSTGVGVAALLILRRALRRFATTSGRNVLTLQTPVPEDIVISQSVHLKCFAALIYSSGHLAALRISISASFGLCPN